MSKQTTTSSVHPSEEQADQVLLVELGEVDAAIRASLTDLFPPFSQMIDAKRRALGAMKRAAVVLTAGIGTPDTDELHAKRVSLAAALEMLHLALAVHMEIGEISASDTVQYQSLLGSTILAGDYCFSRSADLAVRTGNPVVVEIFSEALKRVSENNLRRFFESASLHLDEDRELFLAGIAAAGQLTGASTALQNAQSQLADDLARSQSSAIHLQTLANTPVFAALSPLQWAGWHALIKWLSVQ